MKQIIIGSLLLIFSSVGAKAAHIFIPMDAEGQANHLKAYGIAYEALKQGLEVDWMLNYQGGSFGIPES